MTGLDSGTPKKLTFWRRQLQPSTTGAQRICDVLFGVVAPVLCFIFDPIVFKNSNFGRAFFPEYQAFAYMVSGVEISLLIIWWLWGRALQPHTRLLGGTLIAGALFSGVIGVILLPFSLLGLVMVIGIFGFIPFITALVYWRNGKAALELDPHPKFKLGWLGTVAFGGVLILGVPAGLTLTASRLMSDSMNAVVYGNPQSADLAVEQISYLRFFARPEVEKLVVAYARETEPARKTELKRRYTRLTGEDIDLQIRSIMD